jgi:hypothetical protein
MSPGDPTLWDTAVDDEPTAAGEAPWRPRPLVDERPAAMPRGEPAPADSFDSFEPVRSIDPTEPFEPVGRVPRWDGPPVPLPDDDLAAPSEAAWFARPAAATGGDDRDVDPGEAWGGGLPPRAPARSRWDDRPGDPDDGR